MLSKLFSKKINLNINDINDINDTSKYLNKDIFYLILEFLTPIECLTKMSILNKFYYFYINNNNNQIWKFYFKKFTFYNDDENIQNNLNKEMFIKYFNYFNKNYFGKVKSVNITKTLQKTLKIENKKNEDIFLISEEPLNKNLIHYFRIKYLTTKYGCSVGLIKESELSKFKQDKNSDFKFIQYYKDGSCTFEETQTIKNRIKKNEEGKLIKLFYPILVNDILGMRVNFFEKNVTFFINGIENVTIENLNLNENYYFCLYLVRDQVFEILSFMKSFNGDEEEQARLQSENKCYQSI
ncbi:hypothetical protein ABK040_003571 [Willaertia magna]